MSVTPPFSVITELLSLDWATALGQNDPAVGILSRGILLDGVVPRASGERFLVNSVRDRYPDGSYKTGEVALV